MEILQREDVDFDINSNLHLLNEEDVRRMKDFELQGVLTSIHGGRKTHDSVSQVPGAYDRLMKSLEFLNKGNLEVSVNMVVTSNNIKEVYETGEGLAKKFNLRGFCATPVVPSPHHENKTILSQEEYIGVLDDLLHLSSEYGTKVFSLHPAIPCMFNDATRKRYERFFKTRGCGAARSTLTFNINGDTRVCSHHEESFGNILNESLEKIVEKMGSWVNGSFIPEECSPCDYAKKCRGGCRITSELINGKPDQIHPYFGGPINKESPPEQAIDFSNARIKEGKIRFREEKNGSFTIFIDRNSFLTTDDEGFYIFRRLIGGADYSQLTQETDRKVLEDRMTSFFKRGLII